MLAAADPYEQQFGIQFETFTHFPAEMLASLHEDLQEELPSTISVVSHGDRSIADLVHVLTEIANSPKPTIEQRTLYLTTLEQIYRRLPFDPRTAANAARTLVIGVEREGRIIAETLGCLPLGHSLHPHGKRIRFERGLLVGLTEIPEIGHYDECVIIDGAIASGATLMALMERLRSITNTFRIYSAHGTLQGVRALARYGANLGGHVRVTVGHVTSGLDSHFYATIPGNPHKVVVGDLGDMISPLVSP
jgi:hypothetical protein